MNWEGINKGRLWVVVVLLGVALYFTVWTFTTYNWR